MSFGALGLVVVHYHTPELVLACVEALRSVARDDGLELAISIVDNGSDESGVTLLRAAAAATDAALLEPRRNLGYAGAANLGLRELSARAPELRAVGVMNPDVVVDAGCLRALVDALQAADVVGPLQFWDASHRFMLPPGERRGAFEELLATLGRHDARFSGWARARWRREARRHWLARGPVDGEPSGSMLVMRRETLEDTGPFDEGYQLFFEETDWLSRVRRRGGRVRFVPGASAVHHYHQSSVRAPEAQQWFASSAARFRRGRYGRAWAALLRRVERRGALGFPTGSLPEAQRLEVPAVSYWVEVSPSPAGYPATAERRDDALATWRLPDDVLRNHRDLPLLVRIVDDAGTELAVGKPTRACGPDLREARTS